MLKDTIRKIVQEQQKVITEQKKTIPRELRKAIDLKIPHAQIISGIRRCGKSTLLKQLIKEVRNGYYFNFEDQRSVGFGVSDFEKLNEIFKEVYGNSNYYFLDEIQNVPEWERFVRRMLDEGKRFVITGSNASLLSRELGTRLTGRHLTYELFPFSYKEMLQFTAQKVSSASFQYYENHGGFPEFLEYNKIEMLQELFEDILTRDIIVRYGIREAKIIKQLALYLITNIGKEFSYLTLTKQFNLGSANTIISYISYFEDCYLLFPIPKFEYSYKKQIVNPKKIYCIDVGLAQANSISFSSDKGRILENTVFLHMRRYHKEIYYFKGDKECDFIVRDKAKKLQAIQVCYEVTEDNKEREIAGLKEAMETLHLKKGVIITFQQEDTIGTIKILPAWKWFLAPAGFIIFLFVSANTTTRIVL